MILHLEVKHMCISALRISGLDQWLPDGRPGLHAVRVGDRGWGMDGLMDGWTKSNCSNMGRFHEESSTVRSGGEGYQVY